MVTTSFFHSAYNFPLFDDCSKLSNRVHALTWTSGATKSIEVIFKNDDNEFVNAQTLTECLTKL